MKKLKNNQKNNFLIVIGSTGLLANLITIFQFSASGNIFKFWSFHWAISIIFVLILLCGGLFLISLGGQKEYADKIFSLLSGIYFVFAMIIYLFFGYYQISCDNSFGDYIGFLFLLGILSSIGIITLKGIYKNYLKYPSYCFSIVNQIYTYLLVKKYVFNEESFHIWNIFGEIIILLIGAGLFIGLYKRSLYDFSNKEDTSSKFVIKSSFIEIPGATKESNKHWI